MQVFRSDGEAHRILRKLAVTCNEIKDWVTLPKHDFQGLFGAVAFANVKLVNHMDRLTTTVDPPKLCEICAPALPYLYWLKEAKTDSALQPVHKIEDIQSYEIAMRDQLPAFHVQVKIENRGSGLGYDILVRPVFNPTRLAHRAARLLPNADNTLGEAAHTITLTAWTEPRHSDSLVFNLRPFAEAIPALDGDHGKCNQPTCFLKLEPPRKLHEEQRVTVGWMQRRELSPAVFTEREDEEEVVSGLQLRLVGRVERTVKCGGGIIADDIGFGKTVMSLALIDLQEAHDTSSFRARQVQAKKDGMEALNATLIIVPPHITEQWQNEAVAFLGISEDQVIVIRTAKSLKKVKLQELRLARIVIVSDQVFADKEYISVLSCLTGQFDPGKSSERAYREWHRNAVSRLRYLVHKYMADESLEAREALTSELQDLVEERNTLNQELLAKRVSQSSRKGKGQARKVKEKPQQKSQPVKSAKLFQDGGIVFESFQFTRIIRDEVGYPNIAASQFVSLARAPHTWLLSATPEKQNLDKIERLARELGLHLARPIDLRLGLPRIAEGPSLSVRTETELCCSYGILKSDRFVKDRHEQAESFLKVFSCSNKAPQCAARVVESVLISSPTLVEKASYEDQQREWRNAEMNSEKLASDILKQILPSIGHDCGSIPQNLVGPALVHAASVPNLGSEATPSIESLRERRRQLLSGAKSYMKHLFEKAIWLAHRLKDCCKADPDSDNHAKVTATLRRWLDAMQDGRFEFFGGADGYIIVLGALFPDLTHSKTDILRQATSEDGIDLVKLRSNIVAAKTRYESHMSIFQHLYETGSSAWVDFYNANPEDVESLDRDNILNLSLEYMCRRNSSELDTAGQESIVRYLADTSLQAAFQKLLFAIQSLSSERPLTQEFKERMGELTAEGLKYECRIRGLKFKASMTKQELMRLIEADEKGCAGQDAYSGPNQNALRPSDGVPLLNTTIRVRGSNVSPTRDAFKDTVNKFSQGVEHLISYANQLRRATVFSFIEEKKDSACDICGSTDDVFVIFECGHILCGDHCLGKETCGEGTTECGSLLESSTIPLTKLSCPERQLKFPENFFTKRGDGAAPTPAGTGSPVSDFPGIRPPVQPVSGVSSKINTILDLIHQIPSDDKIVVFTQYDKILADIMEALRARKIACETTTDLNLEKKRSNARATADALKTVSKVLEDFKSGESRVLVQKLTSPEAAGSNLTCANHVIFATPLVANTQDLYDMYMKQAEGRCVRRGQQKDVFVYHCVTGGTLEVDIFEFRRKAHVRVQPGLSLGHLVERDALEDDLMHSAHYDKTAGSSSRVNSFLNPSEVWKAMEETDYLTTIGTDEESCGIKEQSLEEPSERSGGGA
ncbi:P-loop containing nucleoside triphosphate hydrolase protein [Xylariales sp. AK1849]|nr:P-loop containing nucleoside triphosphate hydrolase protein [Xylariales sp. AK1849]